MNKITLWVVGIIVVVLGAWVLVSGNNAKGGDTGTGPIKIGVMAPLTGDAASYGEPTRKTLQLAADEINAAGGINGRQIELVIEDSKCDSATAVNAAHKLIDTDGVQSIIGGFCSGETIPSVPIAAQAKVLLFSGSASSPALTNASPYFFRDYPSDAAQGKVLADVAYTKKNWKKVAVLQEQTDYAAGVFGSFDAAFKALGGTNVKEEFPSNATDFRSTLTKLKAEKPDALFIDTQTPAASQRILKQLAELGWKPTLILNDVTGGDPDTLSKFSSQVEGAVTAEFLPDETNAKLQTLIAAYKTKYGEDMPYHGYMACEYDALYALKDGIASVGNDGEKLAAWSRTIKDWPGASGSITIGADGDRVSGHSAEIIQGGKKAPLK